ncbi:MAG: hypothetical protein WDN50_21020 [Bradyrhizobium sp.]
MASKFHVASITAACFAATLSASGAAPLKPSPEDRYFAARDAAIKKLQPMYDANNFDAASKAEAAAVALQTQMTAVLGERSYKGFGPAKLNLDTLSKGDEGFGMLDGLRFEAETGKGGAKPGTKDAAGEHVQPKAYIIVTTPAMFERWLRGHKDWYDKGVKNVPQQIGAALKDGSFYTQAISTGAAVVNFGNLPIAKPRDAVLAYAMLAGRTQDATPEAADEVFVSAVTADKVYITYGSIEPPVKIDACLAILADYNKRSEQAYADFQSRKIDKKAYDRLGDLRQRGDDEYKRCFLQRAPQQPSFVEATKQAQALLAAAMEK